MIVRRYGTISKEAFINEEIRGKELRVIDTDGTQLGIMSRQEALDLAEQKKLDLVIECADKYGMAMAFTGMRLFHH